MVSRTRMTISSSRLYLLVVILTLFWLALEANLFRLQIIKHDMFATLAEQQTTKEITLKGVRGEIFDRNHFKLATNTLHYDLAADPVMVENKRLIVQLFSKIFKKPQSYYLNRLEKNKSRFVYLERRIPEAKILEILKLKDVGLICEKQFIRSYPLQENAGQLLGFTDTDNRALSGIEKQYDSLLTGIDGKVALMYDGPRRISYSADHPIKRPIPGSNLYLTLDKNIQTVVENALRDGVKQVKAKSGMAIVMDPQTGAILAMANYPDFNPNKYKIYTSPAVRKNRVITDIFEPGSTFKTFTAAALLQEQKKNIDDLVFCGNGRYRIYNKTFRDSNRGGFAWLTFAKVIEKSSNIGVIKLSENLHSNKLFSYLLKFGFKTKTEIELNGEANGKLAAPGTWSGLSKASISIGYEVGVTALQITTAYCAIVNGGQLPVPYLLSHVETPNGRIHTVNKPYMLRQVISPEVSDIMKTILKNVVVRGTGTKAGIKDIDVGGKTGTAQKINLKDGGYYHNKYLSSFIGFAPFEKPKFVCSIFLDEPKKGYYGGEVAAPIFKVIIENIIGLPSENDFSKPNDLTIVKLDDSVPPLKFITIKNAKRILDQRGRKYEVAGFGSFVEDVEVKNNMIFLKTGPKEIKLTKMPNLKNLSVREALRVIDFTKLRVLVRGEGLVDGQSIKAGKQLDSYSTLILTCK